MREKTSSPIKNDYYIIVQDTNSFKKRGLPVIISVSRRTDIPAFYSDWFFNRLREGFVMVRNPMDFHTVYRLLLKPDVVDMFVFVTKNPGNMLDKLHLLNTFNYYFHFTLNPYDRRIERKVPEKKDLIRIFRQLSEDIGRHRVIWRYDPIILCDGYTKAYHFQYFEELAARLSGYTEKCIISFLDLYKNTIHNAKGLNIRDITHDEMLEFGDHFSKIADRYGLKLETCSEAVDLSQFGIEKGKCIDDRLIERLTGMKVSLPSGYRQRDNCGCIKSVDIGTYQSCLHECLYCYAVKDHDAASALFRQHNPQSPLLFGNVQPGDRIVEKSYKSCLIDQMGFSDLE